MANIGGYTTLGGDFPSVVVTAVDIVTSVGHDTESTWQALIDGKSGIHRLTDEWVDFLDLPAKIGGRMCTDLTVDVSRVEKRRQSYIEQVANVMGKRIWDLAGHPDVDPDRLAVSVGTGIGGGEENIKAVDIMRTQGYRKVSPFAVQMAMPNGPAAIIGLEIGARGGVTTPVSACASGNEAIHHAWKQIVMGEADMVVTGGLENRIESVPIACFSMMRAMSTRNDEPEKASRPFDRDRDGFVFGEAAALMVLETEEHALARGAKPIARLLGSGLTSDGYHIVAPDPAGTGGARAMKRAMQTAGVTPDQIHLINAHATGTFIGDISEAQAIEDVIGTHPAVYAPKGALGHSIGAVGALEAALTVLSIRDQIVPPTLNFDNPLYLEDISEKLKSGGKEQDAATTTIDVVHGQARKTNIDYAINNSFGFGGHNVATLFGKY